MRLKTKQLRLLQPQEFRLATERIYKHDTLTETLWNSLDAAKHGLDPFIRAHDLALEKNKLKASILHKRQTQSSLHLGRTGTHASLHSAASTLNQSPIPDFLPDEAPPPMLLRPFLRKLGPADAPDPSNIFLRILQGTAPADTVDDDGDLFSFRDIRPASRLHLLVIPKRFVRDASQLAGPADADLVRRMERKAVELVRAEVGADAFDANELALGFHWPPWYSVPWLHLHAIYPKKDIIRWYKYTPFSFYSPERVLRNIEARL